MKPNVLIPECRPFLNYKQQQNIKMINDKFQPMHLTERKAQTPLFNNVKQAFSVSTDSKKQVSKYLVINSTKKISENIFINAPICPIFIHRTKSYIYLQGECFWSYFLARKQKDIVLTEQQIWILLTQICRSLLILRQNGFEHKHIKQYAIRRVNSQQFKLIYHPDMNLPIDLIEEKKSAWYQFYLAPQQLNTFINEEVNSCVFSIGAMILNIMNPLDFKRDIYSFQKKDLNQKVIQEKLKNAVSGFYSKKLIQIIALTLIIDHQKRISLSQLMDLVNSNNPISKKMKQLQNWKQTVSYRLSKSREKRQASEVVKLINFERGTFGGRTEDNEQSQQQSQFNENKQYEQQKMAKHNHKESANMTKYNQYNSQTYKKSESKKIEKPLTITNQNTNKSYTQDLSQQQDNSIIKLSKLTIFQQNQQSQVIKYQIDEFNERICEYHIKLTECLQPIEDLAKQIGYEPVWIDQNIYYGQLVNGRRNGVGLEIFANREYYYGHFQNDLFHGEGFYFWNNFQYFLGYFQSGNKVQGTWYGKSKYVGQIKKNKRHGIGSCHYASGKIYQGQWFQGKYQGSGIITQPSGQKFIGLFREGKRWGKGYFLAENCRITGVWDGDQAIGSVQIIYENGNVYKGLVNLDFEKHGQGYYKFKTGVVCQGIFDKDQFIKGEIRYKNGQKYIGQVKQFKRHGMGKYYYLNGKIAQGKWFDGVIMN